MNKKSLVIITAIVLLGAVAGTNAYAGGGSELAFVRAATARFHQTDTAQAEGWDLVDGLDHCFENPGVGAMGFHFINAELLDTELDPEAPEAMVYEPLPDGNLKLVGVEYIVPAEPWDVIGGGSPPKLLGQSFHLNEALGVYVLHAWIWKNNPSGMFEDWNPQVSCN
jgi:hypothetical protein